MTIPQHIAAQFRAVYFGGNWTVSNLKEQLADVSWQQATTALHGCNTIATLVNHLHYYVRALTGVLQGGPLDAKDAYSFAHPPISSAEEWEAFLAPIWEEAEQFAALVEQFPEERLDENFLDGKYGSWYRNLTGIIEHCHYHLGQIAVLKKMHRSSAVSPAQASF